MGRNLEWYVFGDLLFLADVVNGVAAMTAPFGTDAMNDYTGILKIAAVIGVIMMFIQGMGGGFVQPLARLAMVAVFFTMMMAPKVTVTMENVYSGATRTIAGVPFGIGLAGEIFSFIGLRLTELVETAYSFPGVTDDGLNASLDRWRTLRRIAGDPSLYAAANDAGGGDFARSWVSYISTCTAFGLDVGNLNLTGIESNNLVHNAVYNPSRSFGALIYVEGGASLNLDCVDAHARLMTYSRTVFLPAFKDDVLAQQFFDPVRDAPLAGPGTPAWTLVEPKLDTMFTVLGGLGAVTLDDALLSVLVGSLYDHGAMRRLQLDRKDAYAVMLGDAIRARNAQWIAQGDIFQTYMKPMLSFIEGFWFAVFPLVAVALLLGPSGLSVLMRFLQIGLWIQLWGPCMAVVNLFVYHGVVGDLANLDAAALTLTSLGGQFSADSVVQQYLGVAGLFASTVPALALLLVTGSMFTLNGIAASVGGPDTISEANAAPARQALSPVIQVASAYEDGPMHGLMRGGAPAQMPKLDLRSIAENRLQSAESELAGARTTFARSIDQTLSRVTGNDRESFSGSLWRSGVSASNSDVYQATQNDDFRNTHQKMRSSGLSDAEIATFTAAVGASVSSGNSATQAVKGVLDGKLGADWQSRNTISNDKKEQWASEIARAFSESEQNQASLVTAFSNDQERGWKESGYSRNSFTTSESVRQEGQDYAGSERRFENAASFANSVGTSASPDVAMLARRIVEDPERFAAFRQIMGETDMVGQATQKAQELQAWGWGADSIDSRRASLVAGGLLALAENGKYAALQTAIGPDGFEVAQPGDPRAYRGVGDELGSGPVVQFPRGGVGGYNPPSAPFDVPAQHQANVDRARAALDAELAPVMQGEMRTEAAEAVASAAAGRADPSWLQTLDARVAEAFGSDDMRAALNRRYQSEAIAAGLSEPEAAYYAYVRSNPEIDTDAERQNRVELGIEVARQFPELPTAARAQLAELGEAAVATEGRRDQLFQSITTRAERVGAGVDEEELDMMQRNMR